MPTLLIEYTDPLEGFKGWLVMDRLRYRLSAGGMRVQPGLTGEHLAAMARNMTRKMRLAELAVDGAKCGIDYDPASPGKGAAIGRFLGAIKPYITSRYSMGPDLNVEMSELERAAHSLGIPSVKMAVAQAQGWDLPYFLERSRTLEEKVGDFTLGQLRAGYGVAAAALGTLARLGIEPAQARVAVQGFGTLGRAALFGLAEAGCRIVAIGDARQTLTSKEGEGLPVEFLLKHPPPLLPPAALLPGATSRPRAEIFNCPADLLIPAALENTVTPEIAASLQVKAVVPGANLAVPAASALILQQRGIPVLPDFLVGCGGSLSMEGLYGPDAQPSARQVLDHVRDKMHRLVKEVLDQSRRDGCSPGDAALRIIASRPALEERRPYELTEQTRPTKIEPNHAQPPL
ncbi:MAG TPA: Glu/Leu/Phe/Val dehydrogenase dimerization domain-containing protein [Desulfurivibrionaceae bacterium]|nr:Glu/Leu/Phe/Val dehydrogenase dimerization domain-containing protein [Desulfurivibrionaceae bacterium]